MTDSDMPQAPGPTEASAVSKPMTARQRIQRLRATFVDDLPRRLDAIHSLWTSLTASGVAADDVEELHRVLHNLKGTASSFGFVELANAADSAEACVIAELDSGSGVLNSRCVSLVGDSLTALRVQAEVLLKASWGETWNGSAAFSMQGDAQASDSQASRDLVYVCDDDPVLLQKVTSQIACFGYQCHGFSTTAALRSAVLERRPNALVMDIHFPDGSLEGTHALTALHAELGARVPTIFLSGRTDYEARIRAVRAGGQAFLSKPADSLDLISAIDRLSGKKQPGPYRIFIVDDEPGVASYHALLLQEAGMLTFELCNPALILAALEEFRPDLVLMDMYLPQCNGRELAALIRQLPEYVSIPIIYLSSELDHRKQFSALRIGAEGFLTKPVNVEQLIESVSVRAERMRVLRGMMARDSLTGLLNHSETTRALGSAVSAATRTGEILCFVMLDVDHFKHVNDTHGHPTGDQVLLALSRLLQQRLRVSDTVGRYGGEEFALVLRGLDLAQAGELVDRLRVAFSQIVFHTANGDFSCTFSAGVTAVSSLDSLTSVRDAADKALYAAKGAGRNRVELNQSAAAIGDGP